MNVTQPKAAHLATLVERGYSVEGNRVEVTGIVPKIDVASKEALCAVLTDMVGKKQCLTYKSEVGVNGKLYKSIILCGKLAALGKFDFLVMKEDVVKNSEW